MGLSKITDQSFRADVLESREPGVGDCGGGWGGPCGQVAPALEEIGAEMGGKVKIAKLNSDENPSAPQRWGVKGIPTLMIFHKGQVAATRVGALPKSKIKEWIESTVTAA